LRRVCVRGLGFIMAWYAHVRVARIMWYNWYPLHLLLLASCTASCVFTGWDASMYDATPPVWRAWFYTTTLMQQYSIDFLTHVNRFLPEYFMLSFHSFYQCVTIYVLHVWYKSAIDFNKDISHENIYRILFILFVS